MTVTVVVMGPSGVGKSVVAAELITRTGWAFVEGDDLHTDANRAKMAAGHPLTDDDRWPWLRRIAEWIGVQEAAGLSAVVTCSALRHVYRELLCTDHPTVWFAHLTAPTEEIADRIGHRHGHYMPAALLDSQLATLEPLTADEPGSAIDATGTPDEIAERLLAQLPQPAADH
ncbi:gluconokinase [Pseudonocardia sp. GCM10023141]|uniref:gluconokinase n=1 Tax=Pseudonocardia sp. GCM10023141 TaxID=3252653 RepID=UPI003610A543